MIAVYENNVNLVFNSNKQKYGCGQCTRDSKKKAFFYIKITKHINVYPVNLIIFRGDFED